MLPPSLALWVLLAGSAGGPAPKARLADRIIATVNLHAITRNSLAQRLKPVEKGMTPEQHAEAEKVTLQEMIEELLIADDANHLHLETTDADIERAVADVAAQNQLSLEELWKAAKDQGFEKDEYREMLRQKLTELKWLQFKTATMGRPDGGSFPEWMAAQRAQLVIKLRADAVIEVRL
ncbi:MAG: SurA N-terminal domain-containing protein [Myxococcaceae bacterium]